MRSDLRLEEWLAENTLTRDDAVFAPMVSLGGWSAKVFYQAQDNRFVVVPTADDGDGWSVAALTPDEWEDVRDEIDARCYSPLTDVASLEVLSQVLGGALVIRCLAPRLNAQVFGWGALLGDIGALTIHLH